MVKKSFFLAAAVIGVSAVADPVLRGPAVLTRMKESFREGTSDGIAQGRACSLTVTYGDTDGDNWITVTVENEGSTVGATTCTLSEADENLRADEIEGLASTDLIYGNSNFSEDSPLEDEGCRVARIDNRVVVINFSTNITYCQLH